MEEWTLGKKVKEVRLNKQLTQREVAGDFITRNMLSKIENDTATPSIKTIEYIANKLDKPVSYFMDYSTFKELDKSKYSIDLALSYKKFTEKNYESCISDIQLFLNDKNESNIINIQELYNLLALCYLNLAKKNILEKSFSKAKLYYNKCLQINDTSYFIMSELKLEVLKGLLQISILDNEEENINSFKKEYKKELYETNIIFTAESLDLELLMLEKKYEQIIAKYTSISIDSFNPILQSRIYFLVGKAHYKKNNIKDSLKYLIKSKSSIELTDFTYFKSELFDLMGKVYSKNKDFEKAYEYAILSKNIN